MDKGLIFSPVSGWLKVGGISLGVLFSVLLILSVLTIPMMKSQTTQAISLRNEMIEQMDAADSQVDEINREKLESALYQLYDPAELFSIAKSCYGYAIKVNGTNISKSNIFFNIEGDRCVIELIETTDDNLFPQQILSDISPFSGKGHLEDPAFSVFTTTTPFKFDVAEMNGKTVETYRFDDIKVGEIFTIKINNPIVRELLGIGTDVVEITHT